MFHCPTAKAATVKQSRIVRLNPKFTNWIPSSEQDRHLVESLSMPKYNEKLQLLPSAASSLAAVSSLTVASATLTPSACDTPPSERTDEPTDVAAAELEFVRKHCGGCGPCGSVFHALLRHRKHKLSTRVAHMLASGNMCFMHSAFECPVTQCKRVVGACNFLEHMLRNHNTVQIRAMHDDSKPFAIQLDMHKVKQRGGNMCAMIMMYGGKTDSHKCRPAVRGLAMPNGFLPPAYRQYKHHLPVVLMVGQTNWALVHGGDHSEPLDKHLDVVCLWLVSGHTMATLRGTISVYDRQQTMSLSILTEVRNIHDTQNPAQFLGRNWNALRVNHGSMQQLLHNKKDGDSRVVVEVALEEF